jgi:hypothetical protein
MRKVEPVEYAWPDSAYLLGPFFDGPDRNEIIPLGFEEAAEPLEMCMGPYTVRSNEASLDANPLVVTNVDVTAFIQADWDRVFGPIPPARGFLLAYRAGAFSAGRVAEEIVLSKLLPGARLLGDEVAQILLYSEAQDRDVVGPRRGSQSDDLVLVLRDGRALIAESKAAFSGSSYLRRCIPKAVAQLSATLRSNPTLRGAVLCLIDLRKRNVQVITLSYEDLVPDPAVGLSKIASALAAPQS